MNRTAPLEIPSSSRLREAVRRQLCPMPEEVGCVSRPASTLLRTTFSLGAPAGGKETVSLHLSQGPGTVEEASALLSPSLRERLEAQVRGDPLSVVEATFSAAVPGGVWFWEGYRAALYGHDVCFFLRGTGIDLAEDTVQAQILLRKSAGEASSPANATSTASQICFRMAPSSSSSLQYPASALHRHLSTTKLDVLASIFSAVLIHVLQQPLLEAVEGPSAVLLCPTKDMCDECSGLLVEWAERFHLLVHNVWDPLPQATLRLLSAETSRETGGGKVADIVVATPPLWEQLVGGRSMYAAGRTYQALCGTPRLLASPYAALNPSSPSPSPAWETSGSRKGVKRAREEKDRPHGGSDSFLWYVDEREKREALDEMLTVMERFSRSPAPGETGTPPAESLSPTTKGSGWSPSLRVPYHRRPFSPWLRPYQLSFVSQLVLLDVERLAAMGYAPLLDRIRLRRLRSGGMKARSIPRDDEKARQQAEQLLDWLPEDVQTYTVVGAGGGEPIVSRAPCATPSASRSMNPVGGSTESDMIQYEVNALLGSLQQPRTLPSSHPLGVPAYGVATISVGPGLLRTRPELGSDLRESSDAPAPRPTSFSGDALLFRHGFTAATLLLDPSVYEDLVSGVLSECREVWNVFISEEKAERTDRSGAVQADPFECQLAILHHSNSKEEELLTSVGLLLVPQPPPPHTDASAFPSRWSFLVGHLEDKMNGVTFDGHVLRTERVALCDSELSSSPLSRYQILNPGAVNPSDFTQEALTAALQPRCQEVGLPLCFAHLEPLPVPSHVPTPGSRLLAYQCMAAVMSGMNRGRPQQRSSPAVDSPVGTRAVTANQWEYYHLPYACLALSTDMFPPEKPGPRSMPSLESSLLFRLTPPQSSVVAIRSLALPLCKETYASMTPAAIGIAFEQAITNHELAPQNDDGFPRTGRAAPPLCPPPALSVCLEEACRLGRVLSYYVYEHGRSQRFRGCGCSYHLTGRPVVEAVPQSSPSGASPFQLTLFIEFERSEAAAEMVRLFNRQFEEARAASETGSGNAISRFPSATLFFNDVYYKGVVEVESTEQEGERSESLFPAQSDVDEDIFQDTPLLASAIL